MKRILAAAALMLMMMCLVLPAMAEEDKTPTYVLGEGSKEFLTIITVAADSEFKINLFIHTDEENLMDALVNMGVISVEKVSWGYNVTTVLEVEAEGEMYWSILEHNGEKFQQLSTPIQETVVDDGDVFAFVLF